MEVKLENESVKLENHEEKVKVKLEVESVQLENHEEKVKVKLENGSVKMENESVVEKLNVQFQQIDRAPVVLALVDPSTGFHRFSQSGGGCEKSSYSCRRKTEISL